jgi:hypothetical protein
MEFLGYFTFMSLYIKRGRAKTINTDVYAFSRMLSQPLHEQDVV